MGNMDNNFDKFSNTLIKKFTLWKRGIIFWGIFFLLVQVVIIAVSIYYIAELGSTINKISELSKIEASTTITLDRNGLLSADYLAVVIPIFIALVGSFIAFLGMNRLKSFDERLDQIRQEMQEDVEFRVKGEITKDRESFLQQVNGGIQEARKGFLNEVDRAKNNIDDMHKISVKKITDIFSDFESKYGWVKSAIEEASADLNFQSVFEAHSIVEKLRSEKPTNYISIIKKVAEYVGKTSDLSGNSADYHNLSAELAHLNMYNEACMVLKKGREIFPIDVDLLSDTIEYSIKGGMANIAEEAVDNLLKIDLKIWTWRCYEFISDYYREIGQLDNALIYCCKAVDNIPNDEHGYRSEAEIIMKLNSGQKGIDKAIEILQSALNKGVNCPQCAVLLSDILISLGRYEEALIASNRAVQELAQEQPHIEVAPTFAKRGMVNDRIFVKSVNDGNTNASYAVQALLDYSRALSLVEKGLSGLSPIVYRQVSLRMEYLQSALNLEVCADVSEDETNTSNKQYKETCKPSAPISNG